MVSSQNPQPSTYGPRCGGHDAMSDAHNSRQQQNQQQTAMAKGGAGCKIVSPTFFSLFSSPSFWAC